MRIPKSVAAIIIPQAEIAHGGPGENVSILIVTASRPDLVAPVSRAVKSVLGADDPGLVKITASENLAAPRALVQGQLGSFSRGLVVVVVFSVTAILLAAILYGLVMLRRKDFGRRRALGASQRLIITLLLLQIGLSAIVGAAVGGAAETIGSVETGDPLPGQSFVLAVSVIAVAVAVVAALAAARRDPLTELRVP